MKIKLEALLYNSCGECENGWYAEADSVSDAIKKLEDVSLSGSPDCEMTTDFELYYDDVLIYKGDWSRLRELAATEIAERKAFQTLRGEDFSENNLQDYLYKKREWLIIEVLFDSDSKDSIGIWTGTQHDVIDFCHQFETEDSYYSYRFIDRLN
jgi:hypothetical protein